jgi:hypothetical protein
VATDTLIANANRMADKLKETCGEADTRVLRETIQALRDIHGRASNIPAHHGSIICRVAEAALHTIAEVHPQMMR